MDDVCYINKAMYYFLLFLISFSVSQSVLSKTLIVGTADAPPHMIKSSNSGIDIDIPKAILERLGYTLKVRYMPLTRAQREVQSGRIDLMVPLYVAGEAGLYMSTPHVSYRPVAVSLRERNLSIDDMLDLGGFRIATFQGALGYFDDEFSIASKESPLYTEIPNMELLPKMLLAERIDVVVLDLYIFKYFMGQLKSSYELPAVKMHRIFPEVPAAVAFHDRFLRDRFNQELLQIRSDGTYEEIMRKYLIN